MCDFYQDEFRFLGFIVFTKKIKMKEKRVDVIKKWPKPKSIQDI